MKTSIDDWSRHKLVEAKRQDEFDATELTQVASAAYNNGWHALGKVLYNRTIAALAIRHDRKDRANHYIKLSDEILQASKHIYREQT